MEYLPQHDYINGENNRNQHQPAEVEEQPMKDTQIVKEQIAYFMQRLYRQKLTTTSGGNISVRCGDTILITPSGLDKGTITAEQIGEMDMHGKLLGKTFKPSIESQMHLAVYLCRPDIRAIVHAHPVTGCSFAASGIPINTRLGSESYAILGTPAYADYALMGTVELAGKVAKAAGQSNCVIMRNHGVLTVGKTLLEAFDRLEVLENTAIITMNIMNFPADARKELDDEELARIDKLMGR